MHCSICDRTLSTTEITWNPELKTDSHPKGKWEICGTCLDISLDAAFSDGFKPDSSDEEVSEFDPVELLESDDSYVDLRDYLGVNDELL